MRPVESDDHPRDVVLDQHKAEKGEELEILLSEPRCPKASKQNVFVSPEGTAYRGQTTEPIDPSFQSSDIVFADVEPQWI